MVIRSVTALFGPMPTGMSGSGRALDESGQAPIQLLDLPGGDCRKTCETPLGRGVEFTEEPTERPYGIDRGLRDPFGNSIRFTEPKG